MEDRLLVRLCKEGSTDAFRQIYEKYREHLVTLAIALSHDVSVAEDAVQDTFVAFAEDLANFELRSNLKGYLLTCVANRVRDIMRRTERVIAFDEKMPKPVNLTDPGKVIVCNEELEQLSSALATLPNEQREVIALHVLGQAKFKYIAESLALSVNTVKGRYRYGIQKLKSILDSEIRK
jgi:RNA polymerase sigma-70 factor (ECF subfamily)